MCCNKQINYKYRKIIMNLFFLDESGTVIPKNDKLRNLHHKVMIASKGNYSQFNMLKT